MAEIRIASPSPVPIAQSEDSRRSRLQEMLHKCRNDMQAALDEFELPIYYKGAQNSYFIVEHLHSIATLGKSDDTLEVVVVSYGWKQEKEQAQRAPIYVVNYMGFTDPSARKRSPEETVCSNAYSFFDFESLYLRQLPKVAFLQPLDYFYMDVDDRDYLLYSAYRILDRSDTHFCPPDRLRKADEEALQKLAQRPELQEHKQLSTYPIPCFDDAGQAKILLFGFFYEPTANISARLVGWPTLLDRTDSDERPDGNDTIEAVRNSAYLLRDDIVWQHESYTGDDWPQDAPLRSGWKQHLKSLLGRSEELSAWNEFKTFGDLFSWAQTN